MNFYKNFNVNKVAMYLLAITVIAYGLGAFILFKTGGNFIKGTKNNYTIDATKTLSLEGINEISVDISSSKINIIPEGTSGIKAHLYGDIISSSNYTKPELECYKSGDTLVIKQINKTHMSFGFFSSDIKLDVYIPSNYNKNVKLASSSGDININGSKFNKLQCILSSGKLTMNNINVNTFTYSNSSGDLKADKLTTTTTTLDSSSGSIDINMFSGNLKSESSSGDTTVHYSGFDNTIDMHSSSGRIELKLPASAEFNLDASASSGDVSCDFPITVSGKKNDHKLQGTVVNDKNKIILDVSSGDINITLSVAPVL